MALLQIWSYLVIFALTSLTSYFQPRPEQITELKQVISQQSELLKDRAVFFKQPDYPDDAPRRRERGTGSRGNCILGRSGTAGKVMLSALVPAENWGLTISQSPTFWVKVAYESDKVEKELLGKFYLEKANTNEKLTPLTVRLPKTSGVFGISLPQSLEVNQWYRWYLLLDCQLESASRRNAVLWVEGLVQRIERSSLKSQLESKTPEQLITIYAEEGIWYDALNETAQLRCRNPQNFSLAQPWIDLLGDDDVDLEEVNPAQLVCPND